MKLKLTMMTLAAGALFTGKAQMMIQEDFNAPFNSPGWSAQNNSANPGQDWFQPSSAQTFSAYNGGPNDYLAANWASTSNTVTGQTISNWLFTPVVPMMNGAVIQFATRTSTNPANFADRLEVYMSTAGTGLNVGTTPTSLGTFSTLLVSVNPNLSTTGYPGSWTIYTATLSGITGNPTGRFGFRYFVTDGGFGGNNSDYIGLDAVRYFNACGASIPSYTICQGGNVTLSVTGAMSPATYTWSTGPNTPSINVSPNATTTYTLLYEENGTTCPAITSTVTIGSQLSVSVTASQYSVCAGESVTLTANAAASNYSWSTGATTSTVAVTVTNTTTYFVGALSGFCVGGSSITINTYPTPVPVIASASTLYCTSGPSTSVSFTASGTDNYVWVADTIFAPGNTFNYVIPSPNSDTEYTVGVVGISNQGCFGLDTYTVTLSPSPVVNAGVSTTMICVGSSATFTATGASSYVWSSGTSTSGTQAYTGNTAGAITVTVTGSTGSGCSNSKTVNLKVDACAGLNSLSEMNPNIQIYPNPFNSSVNISGFDGIAEIYNVTGQLVYRGEINASEAINTSAFSNGAYMLKLYSFEGQAQGTLKLMKQ